MLCENYLLLPSRYIACHLVAQCSLWRSFTSESIDGANVRLYGYVTLHTLAYLEFVVTFTLSQMSVMIVRVSVVVVSVYL